MGKMEQEEKVERVRERERGRKRAREIYVQRERVMGKEEDMYVHKEKFRGKEKETDRTRIRRHLNIATVQNRIFKIKKLAFRINERTKLIGYIRFNRRKLLCNSLVQTFIKVIIYDIFVNISA